MQARASARSHDFDEKMAWAVIDSLESHVAILDHLGVILRTNRSWSEFAVRNPLVGGTLPRDVGPGVDYLAICSAATGYSSENAMAAHRGIREVIAGKAREFKLEYPCHSPTRQRWFAMRVTPLPRVRPRQVIVVHTDITRVKRAQFEADRAVSELAEVLAALRSSASKVRALIGGESDTHHLAEERRSQSRSPVAKTWLSDAQRLRMLSPREKEVLVALSRGERNADVAARLGLSAKSVSTYRARLMEKLKVETTAELIALVTRVGVIR